MTFLTISEAGASSLPVWLAILIPVIIFIAATILSGYIAYKHKLRQLREGKKHEQAGDEE